MADATGIMAAAAQAPPALNGDNQRKLRDAIEFLKRVAAENVNDGRFAEVMVKLTFQGKQGITQVILKNEETRR